jgi:NAD(P)-dependent dehydrogenase (short-subunit alcohol dehydrogenase family)
MVSAGGGSIINMSSISWMIPSTGQPAYIAAKAAIVGLTRTMAHELGSKNIRVNSVLPGSILTERQRRLWLTPEYEAEILASQALKRSLLPEDVARLVLFLASDDSSAITNQGYVIDGGLGLSVRAKERLGDGSLRFSACYPGGVSGTGSFRRSTCPSGVIGRASISIKSVGALSGERFCRQ